MLIDGQDVLSNDQTLVASASDVVTSSNVINLGDAEKGQGTELIVNAQITETVTSSGAATVKFELVTDSVEALSSVKVLYDSGAIALATLVAGYRFPIRGIPIGAEKYLAGRFTVATADTAAGKAHVSIGPDQPNGAP